MKHLKLIAACLLMLSLPLGAAAQTNIKKAFDNFLKKTNSGSITANHHLAKNPQTMEKTGQYDIYKFTNITDATLSKIKEAFEQDKEKSYSYNTGQNPNIRLRYGDSNQNYIKLMKDGNYIYALFIDPDNTKYRYIYAIDWEKDEVTKAIKGSLIIVYGTTNEYQQELDNKSIFQWKNAKNQTTEYDSASWLTQFNFYSKNLREHKSSSSASMYANQIYKLCKNASSLSDTEKGMVTTELKEIQALLKDNFLKNMLNSAMESLKK